MTTIRPMADGDMAQAAELATQLGYPSTAEEVALRFAALRERSTEAVLVAADAEGRAIGWIHVGRVFSLAVSDTALIGGLVVDEAHRSERIGAELLAAAEAWARDQGVRTMTVSSRVTRDGAHRFYLREGYELRKTSHVFAKPLV